jgi:hypothetical protein
MALRALDAIEGLVGVPKSGLVKRRRRADHTPIFFGGAPQDKRRPEPAPSLVWIRVADRFVFLRY